MKKILFLGVLSLGLAFSACHSHDPNCDDVTPPTVTVAPNTLSGVITDMMGAPLKGATVKLGDKTVTTDENGVYLFNDVAAGNYTLTVSAQNMADVTTDLVVPNSNTTQKLLWSAALPELIKSDINVTVADGGEGEAVSEALSFNDQGKVKIEVDAPEGAVASNAHIFLTPIYTEKSAAVSKATENAMLIGATLSCDDPNLKLSKDIAITFDLDNSVASVATTKKFVNGTWVDVNSTVNNGEVVIYDRDFTSYGIFLPVNVTVSTANEALVFDKSEWNNLYGSRREYVSEAKFSYKAGTEIVTKAQNKLEGLLIEYLARKYGSQVSTLQGTYPLDIELPVGTALRISGNQKRNTVTVTGNSHSVKGITYGTTTVTAVTFNRNHNGGSSSL